MPIRPPSRLNDLTRPTRSACHRARVAASRRRALWPLIALVTTLVTVGAGSRVLAETAQLDGLDGRISYTRAQDSQWDIYASDPTGDNEGQITDTVDANTGDERDPRWSPDGVELAYHTYDGRKTKIWRIPFAGGVATPVTEDTGGSFRAGYPSWHPTSGCLAYAGRAASGGDNTDLMQWCPTGVTPIVTSPIWNESSSDWHPDGTRIAYEAEPVDDDDDNEYWNVRVANADGSGVSDLVAWRNSSERHPRWSPTGDRLAFIVFANSVGMGNGTLWVLDVESGQTTELVRGVAGPAAWSPDGRQIIFTTIVDSGPEPAPPETPVPGSEVKGLYMIDLVNETVHRLRGGAGGAMATPGAYQWGYGPDWTAGTRTPTPAVTDTPTPTNTVPATATSTATPTPDEPTPTPDTRSFIYLPIAFRLYPPPPTPEPETATPTREATAEAPTGEAPSETPAPEVTVTGEASPEPTDPAATEPPATARP